MNQKLTEQQIEYIARYITGEPKELNEIEKLQVEKWRTESTFFETELQNYAKLWKESKLLSNKQTKNYTPNTEKGWEKLSQRIKEYENEHKTEEIENAPVFRPLFKEISKVAAIMIVGLGLGWMIKASFPTESVENISSQNITIHQNSNKPLILPDGSKIWLNEGTEVSYKSDFYTQNQTERNIFLEGEAFFDIARDEKRPFKINVQNQAEVEVLGTSFNVNPKKTEIQVTVASGKVKFKEKTRQKVSNQAVSKEILLTKGDKGVLSLKDDENRPNLQKLPNDDVNYLAWLNRRLVFENMQMYEVIGKVEKHYGIRLKLQNPKIKSCRFTGTFDKTPLSDVLETLSFGANLKIQKSDSTTYLISGLGCQ